MSGQLEAGDLARTIEHTLLSATATAAEVARLCEEAVEHGFFAVCVNPLHVARARELVASSPVRVVSVVSFPLGASSARAAALEAEEACRLGAHEIDVVAPLGLARAGELARATDWLAEVRRAIPGVPLKVILETGYFDEATIGALAEAALRAGADFLKTSTGFGPRGATIEDVRLLRAVARGRARIKASGGIRTRELALALIAEGAERIGTSRGVEIATAPSRATR